MDKLTRTDVSDEPTLNVRVTAALYLSQIDRKKGEALRSLEEAITTASDNSECLSQWHRELPTTTI